MAIATVGTSITVAGTTGVMLLPSWSPADGEFVLVAVNQRTVAIAPTVTGNGYTWTKLADTTSNQGQCRLSLWSAFTTGITPAAGQISISVSPSAAGNGIVAIAMRFTGVDPTTGIEASAVTTGPAVDDNDMLYTVSTIQTSSWALAAGGWRTTPTFTVPAEETLIAQTTGELEAL